MKNNIHVDQGKNCGAGSGEESERDIHSASSKDNQSSSGKKLSENRERSGRAL